MLILAIDTSGQSGGITLAEADKGPFRVIESAAIAGGTFSAQLIPTLAALLKKHGYGVKDLGGFAAASGPGSFTGLRVGLSAIKGLAETLRKPIATVSVLEALASMAARDGKIAAAMDAGKEVFLGIYCRNAEAAAAKSGPQPGTHLDQALIKQHEELLTQQDFLSTLGTERPPSARRRGICVGTVAPMPMSSSLSSPQWLTATRIAQLVIVNRRQNCYRVKPFPWRRWTPAISAGQTSSSKKPLSMANVSAIDISMSRARSSE
jgi:tRNA threonylcarbamoyl adenosine modification protein YeaZ